MKSGANNSDVVQIKKMAEEGYSTEDISDKLQIELACVADFVKPVKKKATTKKETTEPEIVFKD